MSGRAHVHVHVHVRVHVRVHMCMCMCMQALLDGFMACKCSDQLRFKVGDKVMAKVGAS